MFVNANSSLPVDFMVRDISSHEETDHVVCWIRSQFEV